MLTLVWLQDRCEEAGLPVNFASEWPAPLLEALEMRGTQPPAVASV